MAVIKKATVQLFTNVLKVFLDSIPKTTNSTKNNILNIIFPHSETPNTLFGDHNRLKRPQIIKNIKNKKTSFAHLILTLPYDNIIGTAKIIEDTRAGLNAPPHIPPAVQRISKKSRMSYLFIFDSFINLIIDLLFYKRAFTVSFSYRDNTIKKKNKAIIISAIIETTIPDKTLALNNEKTK